MKKYLMTCVTALILFAGSVSYAADQYNSAEEMVRDQKVIRVLLDEAPGYGNQAATINMMNRVRQMGFQGTFEFIYPDGDEEQIGKVINLFNLPKKIPPVYNYEDNQHRKITFIAESEYIKRRTHNEIDSLTLGITGAHDAAIEEICDEMDACKSYAKNFANFTNTRVFVRMQPWFQSPGLDSIDLRDENERRNVVPYGKFLVYPVFSFGDVQQYLTDDPAGKDLVREKPALKALVDGIANKDFNLMPVYGYSFLKEYSHEDEGDTIFPQNIMEVITAGRYAQTNGNPDMQKPLIIPVFYNYTKEVNEISSLLQKDNWGSYESQGGAEMRAAINALGLKKPNVFFTASLTDSDAVKKIQSLHSGQILLLSMGPLPKIVFDGIFSDSETNIWSPFREGEGSLSMLILKGQPQFRCVSYLNDAGDENSTKWEPGFDLVKDAALKSRLKELYGQHGLCALQIWVTNPEIYKNTGELIIESKNASSSFAKYFTDLRYEAYKPENDRIHRGLEEALNVINKVR